MSNENVELMRGEPEIAIKKLAIPIIISMLITASYNIIDGIWVVGLGEAAIAGIGFVNPIFMILVGVSMQHQPLCWSSQSQGSQFLCNTLHCHSSHCIHTFNSNPSTHTKTVASALWSKRRSIKRRIELWNTFVFRFNRFYVFKWCKRNPSR